MIVDDISNIAKIIASARKKQGLTKYAIVKNSKVRIDVTQIDRLEGGESDYHISKLLSVLKVLNIKLVLLEENTIEKA
jgi:transcriptional regulator with XRE-family HTH domain